MKQLFSLFCILSFCFSCGSPSAQDGKEKKLDEFKWFLGNWKGVMQEMDVYETWKMENEHSYNGEGFVMAGKDTMFHESTHLQTQDTDIVYIAAVPGDSAPVPFKLISYKGNKAVFENPQHAFPKTIVYTLVAPDSLVATVDGEEEGKSRHEEFH